MSSTSSDPLRSATCQLNPSITYPNDVIVDPIDHFDRLPDPILLLIFNTIGDVKALGRCSTVCQRFHLLVPLVDHVIVRVDCVISDDSSHSSGSSASLSCDRPRGVFFNIARLVLGTIVKPMQALGHILNKRTASEGSEQASSSSEVSHHSPAEVLRNFKEIRRLKIDLPAGELGLDEGVLLRWKAGFGSTLDSCVILGASSSSLSLMSENPSYPNSFDLCATDDMPESFYTNGSLKLRVVWAISSLIAASARHYLLQPIISDHNTLESLDLTDADGQGVLTMDALQLKELRMKPVSASGSSQRTQVPALSMKLWYASLLEIPGGVILKGATLVAVQPSEGGRAKENWCNDGFSDVSSAFEEPYKTAARMLLKRRMFSLEMNSF